jgi:hypothetical protein
MSPAMEPEATERGWLVEFLGGPWDRQSGFYNREPDEVIQAPLEPPFTYRRAVKLGTGRSDQLVQHLIYEAKNRG